MYTKIIGTGSYLPEQVRTNADLEKMVDTSDEWIVTRTGIRERHIAAPNETVSTMGFEAATRAIEMAGIEKDQIGLIVVRFKACWALKVARHLTLQQPAQVSPMH